MFTYNIHIKMITPHSVHSEHWGDISRYTNKVFSKGFCHDHLLKWKAEAVTTNLNSFHFKQTINRDGKGEDKILKTEDDLRAWWRLDNGKAFYTRLTSEGLKLHTDFGTTEVGGYLFNYYGGLGMTRKGLDRKLYFGFKNLSSHCHSDTRVRVDENGVSIYSCRVLKLAIELISSMEIGELPCSLLLTPGNQNFSKRPSCSATLSETLSFTFWRLKTRNIRLETGKTSLNGSIESPSQDFTIEIFERHTALKY